jgi:hypothetical protein
MANPTNIPISQNPTSTYFNNLNNPGTQPTVSESVYDAVSAFFEGRCSNAAAGLTLTAAFLTSCIVQSLDPMQQLDIFKKTPSQAIDLYLSLFLNNTRFGTSYLGVNTNVQTNQYVARTILP